jgi:molybdenum cofactor guanylyltransferase
VTRPAGVLLTGGASRRLGHDKARLALNGETLAARAARALTEVCDGVVEVGSGVAGIATTQEQPSGAGPLAALVAGADALAFPPALLLLAVDLPLVDAPLLALLAGHDVPGVVVPVAAGERQWTCARYDGSAVSAARDLLDRGVRSLRALVQEVAIVEISEAEWRVVAPSDSFVDVDTAADAQRLGIDLPTRS